MMRQREETAILDAAPSNIQRTPPSEARQWWDSLTQDQRDLHMVNLRNTELVRERDVLEAERDIWRDYCQQLVGLAQMAKGIDNKSLYAAPIVAEVRLQLKESGRQ